MLTATEVLVELHTLAAGDGLTLKHIVTGIEACLADPSVFTSADVAATLQNLRHRSAPCLCRLATP